MKSLKSKVALSAIVLLFALVATIGSTFAWFTVSNTVEIQSMTLNVQSSDSLLIRIYDPETPAPADINDASTYSTTLTTAQIKAQYDYTLWTLAPVTAVQTGYASVDGDVLNVLTTANTDFTRALTAINPVTDANTAVTGKVISIKFWLLSQGDSSIGLHLTEFLASATNAIAARDAVINAVRLSVTGNGDDAKIYGRTTTTIDYDYEYVTGLPGFQTATPNTLIGGFNRIDGMTPASYIDLIEADASNADLGTTDEITTLLSNTPTIVTVTIFVEGWDAQATNNIVAADFNISFKFTI